MLSQQSGISHFVCSRNMHSSTNTHTHNELVSIHKIINKLACLLDNQTFYERVAQQTGARLLNKLAFHHDTQGTWYLQKDIYDNIIEVYISDNNDITLDKYCKIILL